MVLVKPCDRLAQPEVIGADPMTCAAVWTKIHSALARIYGDLRFGPDNIENLRAFESTLRLQAATGAALGFDARAMNALAACIATATHEQIVEEATRRCQSQRRDTGWQDHVERCIDEILTTGYTPTLLGAANLVWELAQHASDGEPQGPIWRVRRVRYRGSVRRTVISLTATAFILQRIALAEPTLMVACATLALSVAIMERIGPRVTRSQAPLLARGARGRKRLPATTE